jgi:hypothetical protein
VILVWFYRHTVCHPPPGHPLLGGRGGSSIAGAPQVGGRLDTVEAHGSMGPSNRAAGGDRVPVSGAAIAAGAAAQVVTDGGSLAPEVSPGGDTNATMGATTVGDPATSTGPVGGGGVSLHRSG